MTKLDGATVLVIGASGGLGSRFTRQLTDAGAEVIQTARTAEVLSGPNTIVADLTDADAASSIVQDALDVNGRLDGIVIAAGVVAFGPVDELTDATLRQLFDVNALGPIRIIREAMPALAESAAAGRDPFVITLSGVVSEAPTFGLAAYSASKSALAAFTQAATRDLRKSGIRVIDARPGHIETGLASHPIAGTAPKFPEGLEPDAVVARILTAIIEDEKDLPSSEF